MSSANLDLYYWLALAHERDQPREALALYKKIESESIGYKDVEGRAAALEAGRPLAAPALRRGAVAAPPPPSRAARPRVRPRRRPLRRRSPSAFRVAAPVPGPPPRPLRPRRPRRAAPAAAAPKAAKPRFVPREEVGRGRLGAIFRAEDQLDGRSVALRVLPDAVLSGNGVLAALAADLKAAAALSHPNHVKVLGFVEREGQRCVVTEFVQGRHLGDALKSGHKMTVQQAHGLGRVVAQYLSFIHGKGLVHGCIQPSNIMVASGVLKVADLGLGRLAHAVPSELDYRAPEAQLDVAGDLYAMAAVLYHVLTGIHPRTQAQGAAMPLPSTLQPGRAGGARQAARPRPPPARRAAPGLRGRGARRAQEHGAARVKRAS